MANPYIHDLSSAPQPVRDEFIEHIRSALIRFNLSRQPGRSCEPLLLQLALAGQTRGGLVARLTWDWLHIDLLWLDETCRGQGYGRLLLQAAEESARAANCVGSCTDTFSFQALEFYRKSGYEVFGRIEDQPVGETRYFLQKQFCVL